VSSESVKAMWTALESVKPEIFAVASVRDAWHFCDNESDANELAELVLAGIKRATAGLLWSYEQDGDPIPLVGDLSVVTDWDGEARCVIRTTSVDVIPFGDVSAEFAAIEGEGDGSLGYWREAHTAAFGRELAASGLSLEPDMLVVCQVFDVVFGAEGEDGTWATE
jgi:uncharacterized protein YhfF